MLDTLETTEKMLKELEISMLKDGIDVKKIKEEAIKEAKREIQGKQSN